MDINFSDYLMIKNTMSINFPDYFMVELTQENIDKGTMGSITGCALALAFKEQCPGENNPSCVEVESGTIRFCEWDFLNTDSDESVYQEFLFDMSDDLTLYAHAYDLDKRRVKPVNIHFNVTDIDIDERNNQIEIHGDGAIDEGISDLIVPRQNLPHIKEIDGMIG